MYSYNSIPNTPCHHHHNYLHSIYPSASASAVSSTQPLLLSAPTPTSLPLIHCQNCLSSSKQFYVFLQCTHVMCLKCCLSLANFEQLTIQCCGLYTAMTDELQQTLVNQIISMKARKNGVGRAIGVSGSILHQDYCDNLQHWPSRFQYRRQFTSSHSKQKSKSRSPTTSSYYKNSTASKGYYRNIKNCSPSPSASLSPSSKCRSRSFLMKMYPPSKALLTGGAHNTENDKNYALNDHGISNNDEKSSTNNNSNNNDSSNSRSILGMYQFSPSNHTATQLVTTNNLDLPKRMKQTTSNTSQNATRAITATAKEQQFAMKTPSSSNNNSKQFGDYHQLQHGKENNSKQPQTQTYPLNFLNLRQLQTQCLAESEPKQRYTSFGNDVGNRVDEANMNMVNKANMNRVDEANMNRVLNDINSNRHSSSYKSILTDNCNIAGKNYEENCSQPRNSQRNNSYNKHKNDINDSNIQGTINITTKSSQRQQQQYTKDTIISNKNHSNGRTNNKSESSADQHNQLGYLGQCQDYTQQQQSSMVNRSLSHNKNSKDMMNRASSKSKRNIGNHNHNSKGKDSGRDNDRGNDNSNGDVVKRIRKDFSNQKIKNDKETLVPLLSSKMQQLQQLTDTASTTSRRRKTQDHREGQTILDQAMQSPPPSFGNIKTNGSGVAGDIGKVNNNNDAYCYYYNSSKIPTSQSQELTAAMMMSTSESESQQWLKWRSNFNQEFQNISQKAAYLMRLRLQNSSSGCGLFGADQIFPQQLSSLPRSHYPHPNLHINTQGVCWKNHQSLTDRIMARLQYHKEKMDIQLLSHHYCNENNADVGSE